MNSVLKKGILLGFILVLLLAPVSFGVVGTGANIAHAEGSVIEEALVKVAVGPLLDSIAGTLLGLTGGILTMSGIFLNEVIEKTIVGMGEIVNQLSGIRSAWSTIRDVINMTFIFILLYASIQIILRRGGYTLQSILIKVIIAALLINFSLFVVRFVADVSNTVTIFLYNPIVESIPKGVTIIEIDGAPDIKSLGLSSVFMNELDLQTVFNGEDVTKAFEYQILASIFFLVAAFVFFAIALLFVARFIVFIILMITAPIGFIGGLLPGVGGYSQQWLQALGSQATFPPIFMLMVLMIFRIMRGVDGNGGISAVFKASSNNGFAQSFTGGSTIIIINFAIIIGLLIMALIIAKSTATTGAGKLVSSVTEFGGKAILGSGAFLGRQTLGRAGNVIAQSDALRGLASSESVAGRFAGRLALRTGDKLRTGSFDARASRLGSSLTSTTGVNLGKAQKDGFLRRREKAEKKKAEREVKLYTGVASEETRKKVATEEANLRSAIDAANKDGVSTAQAKSAFAANAEKHKSFVDTRDKIKPQESGLQKREREIETIISSGSYGTPAQKKELEEEQKKIKDSIAKLSNAEAEIAQIEKDVAFRHGESISKAQAELNRLSKDAGDEAKSAKTSFLEYRKAQKNRGIPGKVRRFTFESDARVAQAALKELGKSEDQKVFDMLKKIREKQEKEGEGDGGKGGENQNKTDA